jgi:hypothetical protein
MKLLWMPHLWHRDLWWRHIWRPRNWLYFQRDTWQQCYIVTIFGFTFFFDNRP